MDVEILDVILFILQCQHFYYYTSIGRKVRKWRICIEINWNLFRLDSNCSICNRSCNNEKIGDYYTGVRRVLTRIFGTREVLTYVTAAEKEHGTKRLFFSTVFPEDLQIFCAWQEKVPLNQTGSDRMKYIPLFLYSFRWNIETSYYEQKTFWSFCSYMVRSCKGIEMLVNLINISYCAMKILPYQNEHFSEYRTKSVQEFRFELSQGIHSQIFFTTFVKNIETHIKSNAMTRVLKQLVCQQVYHL